MAKSLSRSIELIRRSHAELGTARFLLLNVLLLGWITAFFYLAATAEWPAGCGIDGIVETYRCSIPLAATGAPRAIAFVLWLWLTPVLIIVYIARKASRLRARGSRGR